MKRTRFILSLALTIILVSCGNDNVNTPEISEITTQQNNVGTGSELTIDSLPDEDFGGADFNFLVCNGSQHSGYYIVNDIYAETLNADPFNDAVYERNRAVEEKYNIHITQTYSDKVSDEVIKTVNAGDSPYDAVFDHHYALYQLASQGYFVDFNRVNHLDMTAEWWDQNSIDNFNFAGRNYFITGDISTLDDTCTRLCLFNKKLIEDFKLESPYDLIRSNNWTFDNFSELVLAVSNDLDGDGVMKAGDQFGLISEASLTTTLFDALGGKFFTRSGDDFVFNADSAESFERYEAIFNLLLNSDSCAYISNWSDKGGFSNVYTYARSLFTQDKFLFHFTGPLTFNEFRDMESDFGIVPPPKYDKEQERYYCYVDPQAPMLAVSSGTPDIDKVGIILEAMAAQSKNIVTPAFHETLLKRKHVRDNESAVMLDIIDKSRLYTVELVTGWGGIGDIAPNKARTNQRALISDFAAVKAQTEAQIESAMELFASLE